MWPERRHNRAIRHDVDRASSVAKLRGAVPARISTRCCFQREGGRKRTSAPAGQPGFANAPPVELSPVEGWCAQVEEHATIAGRRASREHAARVFRRDDRQCPNGDVRSAHDAFAQLVLEGAEERRLRHGPQGRQGPLILVGHAVGPHDEPEL